MSSEEIYAEIWNLYNEAFDGNMAAITANIAGSVEWARVNNHFVNEINRHVFIPEVNSAREAAGEANSYEEKMALEKDFQRGAGKNTTLDFLKMQSELKRTGVLEHKMGDQARMYCDLIQTQLEFAFNPNYTQKDGLGGVNLHISTDQWNRVANQSFNAAKLAAGMKEQLGRIRSADGYTDDIVKIWRTVFNQFVKGAIDDGLNQLIGETKNNSGTDSKCSSGERAAALSPDFPVTRPLLLLPHCHFSVTGLW